MKANDRRSSQSKSLDKNIDFEQYMKNQTDNADHNTQGQTQVPTMKVKSQVVKTPSEHGSKNNNLKTPDLNLDAKTSVSG